MYKIECYLHSLILILTSTKLVQLPEAVWFLAQKAEMSIRFYFDIECPPWDKNHGRSVKYDKLECNKNLCKMLYVKCKINQICTLIEST